MRNYLIEPDEDGKSVSSPSLISDGVHLLIGSEYSGLTYMIAGSAIYDIEHDQHVIYLYDTDRSRECFLHLCNIDKSYDVLGCIHDPVCIYTRANTPTVVLVDVRLQGAMFRLNSTIRSLEGDYSVYIDADHRTIDDWLQDMDTYTSTCMKEKMPSISCNGIVRVIRCVGESSKSVWYSNKDDVPSEDVVMNIARSTEMTIPIEPLDSSVVATVNFKS